MEIQDESVRQTGKTSRANVSLGLGGSMARIGTDYARGIREGA